MKLILYNNHSENNNINKTIIKIIELEGSLLDSTSIINPIIKIYFKPENHKGYVVEDNMEYIVYNGLKITWDSFIYDYVLASNYAYIPEFNRYYFINDIISVRKNIWQIELHVDVLMSYKEYFLKLNAFISRNEFNYVMDAVDELRDFHYPKQIYYDAITHLDGFTPDEFDIQLGQILISVLADDANSSPLHPSRLPNDIDNIHVNIDNQVQGIDSNTLFYTNPVISGIQDTLNTLLKEIYKSETLRSFVKYIKAYPFRFDGRKYQDASGDSSQTWSMYFHIGEVDNIYAGSMGAYQPHYNVIVKCMADFVLDDILGYSYQNEWLKAEPYTVVELWIPFYNYVKIPYVKVHNHELKLYYITTIGNGDTTAILYDADDNKILWSSKVECSIDFSLSTTNAYENEKKKDALITSTAIGALSSVVSTALGVVTQNPVMVAGGVMGGVSTVTKAVTSASQIFETANVSSASVTSGVFNSLVPYIKRTIQAPITLTDEAEYNHLFGKPLKKIIKLSDLHGFTKVDNIMLDHIPNITRTEEETLIALLKEGIVL